MYLCNETITVFNASYDADTGYDVYTGTVVTGASWHCGIESTVDTSGLKAANKFTIRIPEGADFSGKAYADPVAYAGGDPASLFTLQNGDIIVKGEVTETSSKPADLLKNYESFTILGVTDNRRAKAPHWKVVGA
ncbi:MAG: hypothetical protein LIP12_00245 [Clostridiales bacterium]|nr:hypothetical protein [Clostridiales bacterium]